MLAGNSLEREGEHPPLDHVVDLLDPAARSVGEICVAGPVEAQPEGLQKPELARLRGTPSSARAHHDDNLRLRPLAVDALDDLGQGIDVRFSRDVVRSAVVVGADVDDDDVSSGALAEVPRLRLVC